MSINEMGELAFIPSYKKLVGEFPRIKEIMEDEQHHAKLALESK